MISYPNKSNSNQLTVTQWCNAKYKMTTTEFQYTHSNTVESFWSPQIRISAMHRNDSTNNPLLFSDTVWLRSSTLCRYFRWSNDRRFFGLPAHPPNQLRLRNIFFLFWIGTAYDFLKNCFFISFTLSVCWMYSWMCHCQISKVLDSKFGIILIMKMKTLLTNFHVDVCRTKI